MARFISLILAVILAFIALRLLPGDAVTAELVQSGASETFIQERRAALGLDKPLLEQFIHYFSRMMRGDLGVSLSRGLPVSEMILQAMPPTLTLALAAFILGCGLGVFLGIMGAMYRNTSLIISLILSTPIYWTGTLALFIFSAKLRLFPASGDTSLILPAAVLGLHSAGSIAQVVRSSISQTLHLDFVRTARGKGLPERYILIRHVLRASLIPVVSVAALQAGFLFSGTVIVETLFLRPGLGRLLLDAVQRRDYPVVQGVILVSAVLYAAVNIIADLLYPRLDPRIRL